MRNIHAAPHADHDTTVSWSSWAADYLVARPVITHVGPRGYPAVIMLLQDRKTPKGYRCNRNPRIVAAGAKTVYPQR